LYIVEYGISEACIMKYAFYLSYNDYVNENTGTAMRIRKGREAILKGGFCLETVAALWRVSRENPMWKKTGPHHITLSEKVPRGVFRLQLPSLASRDLEGKSPRLTFGYICDSK
jgi:hypothetical protein